MSPFNIVACADNSSLVAEASCAVAALLCTTSEIWLMPCSACRIASVWSSTIVLRLLEKSAICLMPSTTEPIAFAAFSAARFPSETSRIEPSISSRVSTAALALWFASTRIWSATTAKPRPDSPARAASIDAVRESRFVWEARDSLSELRSPVLVDAAGLRGGAPVATGEVPAMAAVLKGLRLPVTGLGDPRQCQVHRGGLRASAVDVATCAVVAVPGLFVVGEALDVDAPCGGYNLHWAWASGLLAGRAAVARMAGRPESKERAR